MKLIRVEHPLSGDGPFTTPSYVDVWRPSWHPEEYLFDPLPEVDGLLIETWQDSYKFGFANKSQFFDWFGDEYSFGELEGEGFEILQLTIDPEFVFMGGHQVVFHSDRVTRRRGLEWGALYDERMDYETKMLGIPTEREKVNAA